MLFKNYETIQYRIGNRTVNLVDIFRNITFKNTETSLAYDDYYIQDGESPEDISAKLYGSTEYSWLILMVNNIAHIKDEWFISAEDFIKEQERDFGGDAFYISALPDLVPGDILVKVTATASDNLAADIVDINTYRHVAEFDPYFRKIRGICGAGSFSSGDLILFARQNPENGTVTQIFFDNQESVAKTTDFTNILFKESYSSSVEYFYNGQNLIIDPYRLNASGSTSINANTLYTSETDTTTENNFALCILYKYGACGGTAPFGLSKKTVREDEYDKYIKKQKIKVLRKDYLSPVIIAVENALQSNTIGKKLRIEI